MKYTMNVSITDPNTPKGMYSGITFNLACTFVHNPDTYGNGYYVGIAGKEFYKQVIDLRYDTSFNPDKKEEWLENWAKNYWTGKDGAWAIKSLEIVKE